MQEAIRTTIDRVFEYPVHVFSGGAKNSYKTYGQTEKTQLIIKVAIAASLSFVTCFLTPLPAIIIVPIVVFYTAAYDLHSRDKTYVNKNYFTEFCLKIAKKTQTNDQTKYSKIAEAIRAFATSGKKNTPPPSTSNVDDIKNTVQQKVFDTLNTKLNP